MPKDTRLGHKIRSLRRREGLTQVQLAEKLEISPSYLNLIEHNRRPLSAALLIKVAQLFQLDLQAFAVDNDRQLVSDLLEVFGDPLFDGHELGGNDVRELVSTSPGVSKAVLTLYRTYRSVAETFDGLASALSGQEEVAAVDQIRSPAEEVADFMQRRGNYFPEIEEGAEQLAHQAKLAHSDLFAELERYLKDHHGVQVQIQKVGAMRGAVRRYDRDRRVLYLSEVLRRGSRNFQLAHQTCLLTQSETLERLARDQSLTTDESRALGEFNWSLQHMRSCNEEDTKAKASIGACLSGTDAIAGSPTGMAA